MPEPENRRCSRKRKFSEELSSSSLAPNLLLQNSQQQIHMPTSLANNTNTPANPVHFFFFFYTFVLSVFDIYMIYEVLNF